MVPTVCKRNIGVDRLFHVVINLYEGADFIDKKGHIHPEVAKEIMDWHQSLPNFKDHGEHPADIPMAKNRWVKCSAIFISIMDPIWRKPLMQ